MVNHSILRKKFPSKNKSGKKKDISSVKKAIALEYRQKRAELGFSLPTVKRGLPYYMVILIGLCLIGGLVGSAIFKRKGLDLTGSKQASAVKSLNTLAIALGRYRYHVGTYPTTQEGLKQLALTRVRKPGWVGPYINEIYPDPWGNAYVYENLGDNKDPALFSKGPDGEAGTMDDVIADKAFFNEAFRDPSWTDGWVPWHLRGVMWVENDREKEIAERRVDIALGRSTEIEGRIPLVDSWRFSTSTEDTGDLNVRLPLDWRAVASLVRSSETNAVFRRPFFVRKEAEGYYVALRLAAVSGDFAVKLNGVKLAAKDVGREGYEVDMSEALRYGSENELEIFVNALNPEAQSAGITGEVWVDVADPKERVVCGTMKVRFDKVTWDEAVMVVERSVSCKSATNTIVKTVSESFDLHKPRIWTFDNPVVRRGNLMGRYVIRSLEPSTPGSVVFNGRDTPIKGVATDCSLGMLGEAFSDCQAREKFSLFKEAGVNAVLFTGAKTNKAFFDVCDEVGLLAFDTDDIKRLKLDRDCFVPVKGDVNEETLALLRSLYMPEAKTLYLSPHWNWTEGSKAHIECVTDADSVELFVNGTSVGEAEKVSKFRFAKEVAYEAGELKAIAKKNGVYYSEDTLKTAYEPEALRFCSSPAVLKEYDSAVLEVMLSDDLGRSVVNGDVEVEFAVESGPGSIIGCENSKGDIGRIDPGDPRKAVCRLVGGRAFVAVRRGGGSHIPLKIKAKAKGLRSALMVLPYWQPQK